MSINKNFIRSFHSSSNINHKKEKEFITTPYEKVLQILQDIKVFLQTMKKAQEFVIQLDWVVSIISSHSLYTYEFLTHEELIKKYEKEDPEFQEFIGFLSSYGSDYLDAKQQKPDQSLNSSTNVNPRSSSRKLKRKEMTITFKEGPLLIAPQTFNRKNHHNFFTAESDSSIINELIENDHKSKYPRKKVQLRNKKEKEEEKEKEKGKEENEEDKDEEEFYNSKLIFEDTDSNLSIEKENQITDQLTSQSLPLFPDLSLTAQTLLSLEYDILSLKDKIGYKNVLPCIGKAIYDIFGLTDQMINNNKLPSFLTALSSSYFESVQYHNAIHASDVTLSVSIIINSSNFEDIVSTNIIDLLSLITSCLGHDLGHPGLNASFHINTQSDLSLTYNDISVLENFHSASLFKLLKKDEYNIFEGLSTFEFKTLRKRIISQIIATDMALHGKVLGVVKSKYQSLNLGEIEVLVDKNSNTLFDDQGALMDFIVHAADIGHNAKRFEISVKWVTLLMDEFWAQGDKEKEMGVQVSYLCDRNDVDIAKSQVGFLTGFIFPTFEVLVGMFPTLEFLMENVNGNCEQWGQYMKKGWKRFGPEEGEHDEKK